MIIQRLFSKKEKKESGAVEHIAKGALLGYIGGKVGEGAGKAISRGKQIKEVMERVKTELPKKAIAGDQKSAEALSKISSNPRKFLVQITKATENSPRTIKAGKIGKAVGIALPTTAITASYFKKKKKS